MLSPIEKGRLVGYGMSYRMHKGSVGVCRACGKDKEIKQRSYLKRYKGYERSYRERIVGWDAIKGHTRLVGYQRPCRSF